MPSSRLASSLLPSSSACGPCLPSSHNMDGIAPGIKLMHGIHTEPKRQVGARDPLLRLLPEQGKRVLEALSRSTYIFPQTGPHMAASASPRGQGDLTEASAGEGGWKGVRMGRQEPVKGMSSNHYGRGHSILEDTCLQGS